jgi:peptide/nickel transport system substrate-binding protein
LILAEKPNILHTPNIFEEEKMKKWLAIPLVLLLVLIILVSSCGSAEKTTTATSKPPATTTTSAPTTTSGPPPTTEKPAPYGTLTGATATFGYDTFDPNLVSGWAALLWQSIVRTTQDLNFEGDVLESWDISEDGLTWTFHILPDNYFTNGDPVTAADVKFSIERFQTSTRSPWAPYLRDTYNFVGMTIIDDVTLEYTTAYPEATLLPVFSATYVLDKTEFDRVGEEEYFKNPIGSGPWKYVGYVAGTSVKFEANMGYCRPDEVSAFQFYQELLVPELATRIAMFKTGQIDVLGLDDYARMKELENEGWPTIEYGIPGSDSFAFQWSWLEEAGAVHDIRIRQAMSYALNRQEICDTWYSGYAVPGGRFFMAHGIFGWDDALADAPYDPEMAESLIAQAGYPDAFANPVITVFCQTADQDRMLYYMSYWQAVGLQVELKTFETATYYSYLGFGPPPGGNEGWIWFWKSWSYPNSVYHSANMYTSVGVHKTTNDPTADAMYAEITHQKSYEVAWEKMREFQLYVMGLYTNIGVVEYKALFLYNPNTIGSFEGRNWESYYAALLGAKHPAP